MNFKLIFKSLVILAVLALLVIMGMNNHELVKLSMPPILPHTQSQPAALMYFGFFALGFLAGGVLMAGGGGKKGASSGSKPPKAQT
jgi:uncharacterized membrane protein YciS (DUF1049 family)